MQAWQDDAAVRARGPQAGEVVTDRGAGKQEVVQERPLGPDADTVPVSATRAGPSCSRRAGRAGCAASVIAPTRRDDRGFRTILAQATLRIMRPRFIHLTY